MISSRTRIVLRSRPRGVAGAPTLAFVTTSTPRWGSVTIDCLDPERMAQFWAAMLGTSVRGRWEQYVNLHPVAGGPVLAFQRVEAKSPGKTHCTWTCTWRTNGSGMKLRGGPRTSAGGL